MPCRHQSWLGNLSNTNWWQQWAVDTWTLYYWLQSSRGRSFYNLRRAVCRTEPHNFQSKFLTVEFYSKDCFQTIANIRGVNKNINTVMFAILPSCKWLTLHYECRQFRNHRHMKFQWAIAIICIGLTFPFGCTTEWGRAWKAASYADWWIWAGNPEIGFAVAWLHRRMKIFHQSESRGFHRCVLILLLQVKLGLEMRRESYVAHLPLVVLGLPFQSNCPIIGSDLCTMGYGHGYRTGQVEARRAVRHCGAQEDLGLLFRHSAASTERENTLNILKILNI